MKPVHEKAVVIGISGPSSSGKTTLARLLQRVFYGVDLKPKDSRLNTFIIHEDDFYFPDDKYVYLFFSPIYIPHLVSAKQSYINPNPNPTPNKPHTNRPQNPIHNNPLRQKNPRLGHSLRNRHPLPHPSTELRPRKRHPPTPTPEQGRPKRRNRFRRARRDRARAARYY